jgi:hypothetical protein
MREGTSGGPYSPVKSSIYKSQTGNLTDKSSWYQYGATAINTNLIRYADILLMAAEAEVELGANGDLTKAQEYVNLIRNRAADQSGWFAEYIDDPGSIAWFFKC